MATIEKMIRLPARRRRLVLVGLDNPIHIVFIVVILLLVFGAKRLPEIGRSLGTGMREFKDSVSGNSAQQPPALTPTAQQPQQAPVAPPAQAPVAVPPQAAPAQAPVEPQPQPQHQA
jgi:sec-independent protein translocase protein TatA